MRSTHGSPSTDATLRLLADGTRRQVLRRLAASDGPVSVDRLVAALAADGRRDDETGETRETHDPDRLAIHLHHVHLPKLADAGVVDYDADAGTLQYRGDRQIEALLAACSASG